MDIYTTLRTALKSAIEEHGLAGQTLSVRCKALAAHEAIGRPKHSDYPIIKGREVMVEADFHGAKGQAFTDEIEQADFPVHELLTMPLDSNRKRATFISGLNAVFRFLDLCGKTVHCKDKIKWGQPPILLWGQSPFYPVASQGRHQKKCQRQVRLDQEI